MYHYGYKLYFYSPAFKNNAAYWIGASDAQTEGEFRWSSGYPFSYSSKSNNAEITMLDLA